MSNFLQLEREIRMLRKRCCCGQNVAEITYQEGLDLMASDGLRPGTLYHITDRDIFLEAITASQFDQEGARVMLIPNWEFFFSGHIYNPLYPYEIGDYVIYNGVVWESATGVEIEPTTSADWVLVSRTTNPEVYPGFTAYKENWFGVIFDYGLDWVSKQWDDRGNVFGGPYDIQSIFGSTNPVDISDWWIAQRNVNPTAPPVTESFYNNISHGIWNNYLTGGDFYHIYENNLGGAIDSNGFTDQIIYNRGYRNISANTVEGTINYHNLTSNDLTSITPPATTHLNGTFVDLDLKLQNDTTVSLQGTMPDNHYRGISQEGVAGETIAFGEIAYLNSDGKWWKALADVAATSAGMLGVVLLNANADEATKILLYGRVHNATLYPTGTIGSPAWLSAATAGLPALAAPSGTTDFVVRKIGFWQTADELFFNPSNDYITIV